MHPRAHAPAVAASASRSRAVAALALAAGIASPALAEDWHWLAADGLWSSPLNWSPLAPPNPASNVFIGSTAAAENAAVTLDVTSSIANLVLTDGMRLNTTNRWLNVAGNTVVSGLNHVGDISYRSRLIVGPRDGVSFSTHNLTLTDEAGLRFDGGLAMVHNVLTVDSQSNIDGDGILHFDGPGITFNNNGMLSTGTDGGLILRQSGGGRYDLDGTSGQGFIHLSTYSNAVNRGCALRIDGPGLSDSFSSSILLGPDSDLFMNLDEAWVADQNSQINMYGFLTAPVVHATIRGSAMDFAGRLRVSGPAGPQAGRLRINSQSITFRPAARIEVTEDARLDLGFETTSNILVEGGVYDVAQGARLIFHAPTELRGGSFSTTSNTESGGLVEFLGQTEWNGSVNFSGFARQTGDAIVTGPTTIKADRFYMSVSNQTDWTINSSLTVNAASVGTAPNVLRGQVNIGGGLGGRLTMNLGVSNQWTIEGSLNLTGLPAGFITRVAGAHLLVDGAVTVPAGRVAIDTAAFFHPGSSLVLTQPTSALRLTQYSYFDTDTSVSGDGTLHNGGTMVLGDGLALNSVGLVNDGYLAVGFEQGVATVDRFTNTHDATFAVQVIGYSTGVEHDALLVTGGPAVLDGILSVGVFSIGEAAQMPHVGDQFTILFASSGVSGTFLNDPFSVWGPSTYEWTILYYPDSVAIRLDNIVPAPASLSLLAAAGVVLSRRRRSPLA